MFLRNGRCLTATSVDSSVATYIASRHLAHRPSSWPVSSRRLWLVPGIHGARVPHLSGRRIHTPGRRGGNSIMNKRPDKIYTIQAESYRASQGSYDTAQRRTYFDLSKQSASTATGRESCREEEQALGSIVQSSAPDTHGVLDNSSLHSDNQLDKVNSHGQEFGPESDHATPYVDLSSNASGHRSENELARKRLLKRLWKIRTFTPRKANWVPLSRILESIQPRRLSAPEQMMMIEVPSDVVKAYTGSLEQNAWIEYVGTGVHVEVTWSPKASSTRTLFLRGSSAAEEVKQKLHDIGKRPFPTEIAAPATLQSINSILGFHEYICEITQRREHRAMERSMVGDHNRFTADRLLKAFTDSDISKFASTVAMNRALCYLNLHWEVKDTADLIYAHCRGIGIAGSTAAMNTRLEHAIRWSNRSLAMSTAHDMKQLGVVPDSHTWSLLYYGTEKEEQRLHIVKALDQAGVEITARSQALLALPLIEDQLKHLPDDAAAWQSFVDDMDSTFGEAQWQSAETLKVILSLTHRRRQHEVGEEVLTSTFSRSPSDYDKLTTEHAKLLKHQRDLGSAVKLFAYAVERDLRDIAIDKIVEILFNTAWDCQSATVCRLLWRYAAVNGFIGLSMRHTVHRALHSNSMTGNYFKGNKPDLMSGENAKAKEALRRWRYKMLRLCIGVDAKYIAGVQEGYPRLLAHFPAGTTSMEMISTYLPVSDGLRGEQSRLMNDILYRDRMAVVYFRTIHRVQFAALLIKAAEADKRSLESEETDASFPAPQMGHEFDLPIFAKTEDELAKDAQIRSRIAADVAFAGTKLREGAENFPGVWKSRDVPADWLLRREVQSRATVAADAGVAGAKLRDEAEESADAGDPDGSATHSDWLFESSDSGRRT